MLIFRHTLSLYLLTMGHTDTDNPYLIAGLKESDPVVFKFIYSLYWEKLYNISFYYTRSEQDAEDIVQDVFISLWARREKLALTGPLENYLVRCTKYTAFFYLKIKYKKAEAFAGAKQVFQSNETEEYIAYKDVQGYIQSVFESVSQKTRDIFYLSRFDGLTYVEISSMLDISVKTVEYHISLALKKISAAPAY